MYGYGDARHIRPPGVVDAEPPSDMAEAYYQQSRYYHILFSTVLAFAASEMHDTIRLPYPPPHNAGSTPNLTKIATSASAKLNPKSPSTTVEVAPLDDELTVFADEGIL